MAVVLEIRVGPFAGRKIPLLGGQTLIIGRAPGRAQFAVPHDNHMSGAHFAVECGPGGCRVIDKRSTNGTFLNGARVQEAMLATGDEIKSGQTVFVVRIVSDDQLPAAPSDPQVSGQASVAAQREAPPIPAARKFPTSPAVPSRSPVVSPLLAPPPGPVPDQPSNLNGAAPASAGQRQPSPQPIPLPPAPRPPVPGSTSPVRPGQPPALAIGSWAF